MKSHDKTLNLNIVYLYKVFFLLLISGVLSNQKVRNKMREYYRNKIKERENR